MGWASRMKGDLHPTTVSTACEADLHMDNSFNGLGTRGGVNASVRVTVNKDR